MNSGGVCWRRAVLAALFCCAGCAAMPTVAPPAAPSTLEARKSGGTFLYVASAFSRLSQYALGSSQPLLSVDTGEDIVSMALTASGSLFAGDGNSSYPTVFVYDAMNLERLRRFNSIPIWALTTSGQGYLYVANCGDGVTVYTPLGKRVETFTAGSIGRALSRSAVRGSFMPRTWPVPSAFTNRRRSRDTWDSCAASRIRSGIRIRWRSARRTRNCSWRTASVARTRSPETE